MEYVTRTINELCQKITDGAHNSPEEDVHGRYPMYSSKDMLYGNFDTENIKRISDDDYHRLVKQDCRPLKNDILIIKDGNSYLKYTFRVKETLDAVILSSIAILRPNCEEIDPDFFVYILRTNAIRNAMANYVSGAAIPRIVLKDFKKMKLQFLSDKSLQSEIAGILLNYDNLIENNTKRIRILEQMAENLYKEWFVRFKFPGHKNVEFVDELPKGWRIQKLENFGINLESGSRPSGGIDDSIIDGVPSLGAEAVNGLAEFDYSSVRNIPYEYYNNLKRGRNKGNHILVYKDGAYIGKVTIFRNKFPFKEYAVNEHVFLMNAENKNFQNYLYFTLHQKEYFITMQNLNRNAAQPGLSRPDINRIKIIVPDEDIVKAFNELVEPIFDEVFLCAKKNRVLTKQRDLLLPRLMSGKLQVK